uniref:protein-tyrosine-phosphatase n=1 Tax=Astatotilapia calliptera TaxID=8154 RepID=A0A3P8NBV5_ASTCA
MSLQLWTSVTDYIYVGNLNAAYNGRTLCRNNIDSIIDMSSAPGESAPSLSLIPCTCSRGKRKRVLVHCRDGYSLAPTCIIQYLMVKQNMRLIAAYELLRAKYPVNIRELLQTGHLTQSGVDLILFPIMLSCCSTPSLLLPQYWILSYRQPRAAVD